MCPPIQLQPQTDDDIVVTVWFVYLLQCSDATYYVGHTRDIVERERAHNAGEGAIYTKRRRPVRLVYVEKCPSQSAALARERQIKRWSGVKKAALIARDFDQLTKLARRRGEAHRAKEVL